MPPFSKHLSVSGFKKTVLTPAGCHLFGLKLFFLLQGNRYKLRIGLGFYLLSFPPRRKLLGKGHLETLRALVLPQSSPTVQVSRCSCGNRGRRITKAICILPDFVPLKKILHQMDADYQTLRQMARRQPQATR